VASGNRFLSDQACLSLCGVDLLQCALNQLLKCPAWSGIPTLSMLKTREDYDPLRGSADNISAA